MRRDIAAHHGASSDNCSLTDTHIRQNDAMWAHKDVVLNDNFSVARRSSGPGVKMGDDRRPEADRAVVSDGYVGGMYFVNVDQLANPDIPADRHSA